MGLIENVTDSTPTQRDLGLNNFHQRHMISPVPGKNWKYYFKSGLNFNSERASLKKPSSFDNGTRESKFLWKLKFSILLFMGTIIITID